ncbi:MAG: hypothetical protein D0528_03970 [Methylococcales bacterium]|nr:MAG: hypothetical protein D0528_03970 [Methylococcales bacterium]
MAITLNHWKNASMYKPLLLVILTLLISGCPNPAAYREPITRFQQASTVVIEGARTEYGLANSIERNAEIDRLAAKKSRIELSNLNDPAIRLLEPDSLNARLAALDTLAKHGQLLLTLASSDAPTRAKDAANSLDDAIVGLSSSLGKVPSDKFKSSAEGFATIAGEAAKLALDAKIAKALDKAIVASEKHVTEILKLIKDDLGDLYERRRSNLSAARKFAVDAYNVELSSQNRKPDTLQQKVSEIKKAEDAWDNLPLLLGAGPGLDAMAQAHQKLVDYAKSSKSPQDLAELVEATDAFVTRAKVIADAIKTIKKAEE